MTRSAMMKLRKEGIQTVSNNNTCKWLQRKPKSVVCSIIKC